jgi:hypothetical protein
MVVLPGFTPLAMPVLTSTVATLVSLEAQVKVVVTAVPAASLATAVKVRVPPVKVVLEAGVTVTVVMADGFGEFAGQPVMAAVMSGVRTRADQNLFMRDLRGVLA